MSTTQHNDNISEYSSDDATNSTAEYSSESSSDSQTDLVLSPVYGPHSKRQQIPLPEYSSDDFSTSDSDSSPNYKPHTKVKLTFPKKQSNPLTIGEQRKLNQIKHNSIDTKDETPAVSANSPDTGTASPYIAPNNDTPNIPHTEEERLAAIEQQRAIIREETKKRDALELSALRLAMKVAITLCARNANTDFEYYDWRAEDIEKMATERKRIVQQQQQSEEAIQQAYHRLFSLNVHNNPLV